MGDIMGDTRLMEDPGVRTQDTGLTFYLASAQTAFTWYDRLHAHAQKDMGGADSCAFGRVGLTA